MYWFSAVTHCPALDPFHAVRKIGSLIVPCLRLPSQEEQQARLAAQHAQRHQEHVAQQEAERAGTNSAFGFGCTFGFPFRSCYHAGLHSYSAGVRAGSFGLLPDALVLFVARLDAK